MDPELELSPVMEETRAADFVLRVADLGNTVVTTFTKFITSGKVHDKRLESMYATLSITASLLTELGTTMKKYENDVPIKDDITRPTCEICQADLEKLLALLQEAIKNGNWVNGGTLGGKPVLTALDPFYLFTVALGGSSAAQEFNYRLSDTRKGLLQLIDAVRYTIFKKLDQQKRLSPEETEEFNRLTIILPHLVRSLDEADKLKKDRLRAATSTERSVKSSRNRPDVGIVSERGRRDSDASSDITLADDADDLKKGGQFVKEDDSDSVCSVDSLGYEYEPRVQFHDTEAVYEEWTLRWSYPQKDVRRSWGLFGIRIKESYEECGFWYVDPEMRSQDELKELHKVAVDGMSTERHRAAIEKAIRAIPKDGGDLIDRLIEDREDATSTWKVKRKWSVVAVRTQKKNPYSSSKKAGKSEKETDWYVVIKGETIDHVKRIIPHRQGDPWFKPARRRYPSPVRIMDRSRVPEFPLCPRPPSRIGRIPGPLTFDRVPSQEEAEKKMNDRGAEMTARV